MNVYNIIISTVFHVQIWPGIATGDRYIMQSFCGFLWEWKDNYQLSVQPLEYQGCFMKYILILTEKTHPLSFKLCVCRLLK